MLSLGVWVSLQGRVEKPVKKSFIALRVLSGQQNVPGLPGL
jgi:hypothetical protein